MNYGIIYDAVKKKAKTTPPNLFIGNVEMAAGIAIVLKEMNQIIDFSKEKEPGDIKKQFMEYMKNKEIAQLSEESKIILELIEKYQVKKMVNETMDDLIKITQYQYN